MQDFAKLTTLQTAHKLTLQIYQLTELFPDKERFGIVSQLRRAASSIPTNIVEGNGRKTHKDFINFLVIARGSIQETRYLLYLSKDLHFINETEYNRLEKEYLKLKFGINALIKKLAD